MKHKIFAVLFCSLFAAGCAHASSSGKKEAAQTQNQNQPKAWTYSLNENGAFKLPKEFTEVQTADKCKLFVFQPAAFSDVDITVRFKSAPSKKDFGGGILFRYNDPQNYYCVRYNAGINNFRFYKAIKGDRAHFANRTVRLKNKTDWHELRLVARGDTLQAYIDGKLYLTREDVILTKGRVGLWVRGDEPKTQFADFAIRQ